MLTELLVLATRVKHHRSNHKMLMGLKTLEADTPIPPYYAVAYCHPPKATGHVFSSFMNHVLAAFLSNIIRKNSIYHTTLWPEYEFFGQIL